MVALNEFLTDTEEEYEFIRKHCKERGCEFARSRVWSEGGEGGKELAQKLLDIIENGINDFRFLYTDALPIEEKIRTIAREIYGADDVEFEGDTLKNIDKITSMGFGKLPVQDTCKGCICQRRSWICGSPYRKDTYHAGTSICTVCKQH